MRESSIAAESRSGTAVGRLLREWRLARGLSQMELAMTSGFSARHLSFIETGRSRPSREALLVLAEALDVPLRQRNRLLESGGYAGAYRQTPIDSDAMSRMRDVLQFIIDRHSPYPAVVLDRYANCIMGNDGATRLMAALVEPELFGEHANHLRLVFHPEGARRWIVNWDEVGNSLLSRAERELDADDDETAESLLEELHVYASTMRRSPAADVDTSDLLLPIHIRKGDLEFRLFSTIMTMGTPRDVTLQEMRIETFFPADDASESAWSAFIASQTNE